MDETLPESARGLLDEDTQRRWSEFVGGALAETNRRNETNLVGIIHDSMYKYMYVVGIDVNSPPLISHGAQIHILFSSYLVTELYEVQLKQFVRPDLLDVLLLEPGGSIFFSGKKFY